ncbi:hypothetical protein [Arthrobacter sp. ok909]|uniref:hypothetical protein n=1 Tax=Arthrobacter sp. ok909 TaxID=1761746 RepID=UPI0011142372|nr:hypothetical protein [Arthrobacter sp. ok909]
MAHSVIDFFVYLAVAGMGLALVLDPPRRCASKTGVTSKTRKVGTPMNSPEIVAAVLGSGRVSAFLVAVVKGAAGRQRFGNVSLKDQMNEA